MTNNRPEQPDTPPAPAAPPLPDTSPPTAPKRRVGPLAAGLIGLAVGAGIVGGAWAITANNESSGPGTFTLEGEFVLTDSVAPSGDGGCAGLRGYDDIREGTSVTVYGAAGEVVGTGSLGNSKYDREDYTCTYKVAVPDVPKGERFYKVEVSHRGTLQLSAKEAEGGEFAGSLG
jgi:hypothetical protein